MQIWTLEGGGLSISGWGEKKNCKEYHTVVAFLDKLGDMRHKKLMHPDPGTHVEKKVVAVDLS